MSIRIGIFWKPSILQPLLSLLLHLHHVILLHCTGVVECSSKTCWKASKWVLEPRNCLLHQCTYIIRFHIDGTSICIFLGRYHLLRIICHLWMLWNVWAIFLAEFSLPACETWWFHRLLCSWGRIKATGRQNTWNLFLVWCEKAVMYSVLKLKIPIWSIHILVKKAQIYWIKNEY